MALEFDSAFDLSGYYVTGCGEDDVTIKIPAKYKGKDGELPILGIYDKAFENKTALKSIIITPNDKFIYIGDSTFNGCSSLISVEIPSSVTSIGDNAFSGCSSLISIEIPNSVTSIGEYAFSGCTSLTNIIIPNSVTSIGDNVFQNCMELKVLLLGDISNIEPPTNAIYYCYPDYLEDYLKHEGWKTYYNNGNLKIDILKSNFLINAQAQHKYFLSKNEFKNTDIKIIEHASIKDMNYGKDPESNKNFSCYSVAYSSNPIYMNLKINIAFGKNPNNDASSDLDDWHIDFNNGKIYDRFFAKITNNLAIPEVSRYISGNAILKGEAHPIYPALCQIKINGQNENYPGYIELVDIFYDYGRYTSNPTVKTICLDGWYLLDARKHDLGASGGEVERPSL